MIPPILRCPAKIRALFAARGLVPIYGRTWTGKGCCLLAVFDPSIAPTYWAGGEVLGLEAHETNQVLSAWDRGGSHKGDSALVRAVLRLRKILRPKKA